MDVRGALEPWARSPQKLGLSAPAQARAAVSSPSTRPPDFPLTEKVRGGQARTAPAERRCLSMAFAAEPGRRGVRTLVSKVAQRSPDRTVRTSSHSRTPIVAEITGLCSLVASSRVEALLITHGHRDHVAATNMFGNAQTYICDADHALMRGDRLPQQFVGLGRDDHRRQSAAGPRRLSETAESRLSVGRGEGGLRLRDQNYGSDGHGTLLSASVAPAR